MAHAWSGAARPTGTISAVSSSAGRKDSGGGVPSSGGASGRGPELVRPPATQTHERLVARHQLAVLQGLPQPAGVAGVGEHVLGGQAVLAVAPTLLEHDDDLLRQRPHRLDLRGAESTLSPVDGAQAPSGRPSRPIRGTPRSPRIRSSPVTSGLSSKRGSIRTSATTIGTASATTSEQKDLSREVSTRSKPHRVDQRHGGRRRAAGLRGEHGQRVVACFGRCVEDPRGS